MTIPLPAAPLPKDSEQRRIALAEAMRSLACRYLLGLLPVEEYHCALQPMVADYQRLSRGRASDGVC